MGEFIYGGIYLLIISQQKHIPFVTKKTLGNDKKNGLKQVKT
jgi:hypothetical protein